MENLKFDDYMMEEVSSNLEDYFNNNIGKVIVWGTGDKPKTILCTRQIGYNPVNAPLPERTGVGLLDVFILDDSYKCVGIEILEIGLIESITHVR